MTVTPTAMLFDMDDTLVATAPLWRDAMAHLLTALGRPDFDLEPHCKGMNALDVAAVAHRLLQPPSPLDQCQGIMRDRLLHNFQHMPLREIDGAVALLQRCAALDLPMAVASGAPMPAIERALAALGMRRHFRLVVTSESVARGKPHPDVFLAAARQLDVPPHRCLVFEDSLVGALAARDAGMRCIVRPSLAHGAIATVAARVVAHWDDVTPADLTAMLAAP